MSKHGWVTPNPDGSVAKCGGPAICAECQEEQSRQPQKKKYFIRYQGMFWKKDARGYTYDMLSAGMFEEGEHGIKGNDLKISDRGDYSVEVGHMLRDLNYTPDLLEQMKGRIDYLKTFLKEDTCTAAQQKS